MRGDNRRRFCEHCKLHVQNLSAMSQRDVSRTLARREHEHVCVTYSRRADGTMVTRWDNLIDWTFGPFRRGFAWLLAACLPMVLTACQTQSQLTGRVNPSCKTPQPKALAAAKEDRVIVTGGI